MKRQILTVCVLATGLFGLRTDAAHAQNRGDERAGTAAMEELLVPVTPRTSALGANLTSGLTGLSGVEAVQSNPAALTTNTGTAALFSRSEYVADIGINYLGVAQSFGNNNVALTINSWDYGDIDRQTQESPEIQEGLTYSASSFVVGASLARQFTDRISAGFTLKGLSRSIASVSSTGIAVDGGMTYTVGESGLRFGVSLKNFGPQMSFSGSGLERPIESEGPDGSGTISGSIEDQPAELPSVLNFGAAYTRQLQGQLNLTALANFQSLAYDADRYTGGLEVGYQDLFFVRGGINIDAEGNDQSAWDVWNVGAGLNLPVGTSSLRVDYAYRPSSVFDGANMFSVGVSF